MAKHTFFISGIDTDSGKTYATGLFARYLLNKGTKVITQKIAQTGCTDISIDIIKHREIMGINLLPEDIQKITCPYCFELAASPHLAAHLEGTEIDLDTITKNTTLLLKKYDYVLLEGAGGLYAPITNSVFTIEYIQTHSLPLLLISSAKIGSINHTILSIEACRRRNIDLQAVVFNQYPPMPDVISENSYNIIRKELLKWYPNAKMILLPLLSGQSNTIDDNFNKFDQLFDC